MKFKNIFCIVCFSFLFAMTANAAELTFSWGTASGEVDGYRIYYGVVQGNFTNFVDAGNATTDTIVLENNNTYYFVVRAYNSFGEGPASNVITWNTAQGEAPAAPTGLTLSTL